MTSIAIVGAGVSGVSCAYQFEQLHFSGKVDIFEKNDASVMNNTYAELIPEIMHRPIDDVLAYLSCNYGLIIKPAARIFHSKNHGPTTEAEFHSFIGHVVLRGGDETSLENQLRRQIHTKIHYGVTPILSQLQAQYDYIVIASGNWDYIPQVTRFRIDERVAFHYAIVTEAREKISANQVEQWLNTRYAPGGYCYKMPLGEGKAMMTCAGMIDEQHDPIQAGWERFKDEQIHGSYEMLEEHHLVNYLLGCPDKVRTDIIFLTGTNAGCNNPLFGFGLFNSILSGIYAADSIVLGDNYEDKMAFIKDEYERSLVMLRRMHALGNTGYDLIIRAAATDTASRLVEAGGPNVMDWLGRLAQWSSFADKSQDILETGEQLNIVNHIIYNKSEQIRQPF